MARLLINPVERADKVPPFKLLYSLIGTREKRDEIVDVLNWSVKTFYNRLHKNNLTDAEAAVVAEKLGCPIHLLKN